MTTHIAHFSITGEFITDMARSFVREGNWEKGLNFLTESLEGMSTDMAIDILKGKLLLDGVDSNIQPNADTQESIDEMQNSLDWQYGKVCKIDDAYYIPYAAVVSATSTDYYGRKQYFEPGTSQKEIIKSRCMFYAHSQEDKHIMLRIPQEYNGRNCDSDYPVLFEKAGISPPFWYTGMKKSLQEAVDFAIKRIDFYIIDPIKDENEQLAAEKVEYGPDDIPEYVPNPHIEAKLREEEEYDEKAAAKQWKDSIKIYHDEIVKQADGRFIDVVNKKTKQVYKVPEVPMLYWAAHYNHRLYAKLPEWNPVCPSGLKLMNDNVFHSDALVGAGIDPDDWTYFKFEDPLVRAFDDKIYEIQESYFGHKIKILAGSGYVSGRLVLHTDEVKPGDILVIPHAGPEFQLQAETVCKKNKDGKSGAVITEVGSALAHLIKVSKELNLRIVRMDNALTELAIGSLVEINFDKGELDYKLMFGDY